MTEARRHLALSMAIYVVAVVGLGLTSWLTGPAFFELGRIAVVGEAEAWVLRVAEHGVGEITGKAARALYRNVAAHGGVLPLVAAWLSLVAKQTSWIDVLTALRFPYLIVTATIPVSVFWIAERGLGAPIATLAAVLVIAQSWFLHGAALGSPDAVVSAFWLLVMAGHVRGLPRAREGRREASLRGPLVASAALGVGLAVDLAVAWVVVPLVVHGAVVHRRALRAALRRGRLPVPATAIVALAVTPTAFIACAPDVVGRSPSGLVQRLFGPLDTQSPAFDYLGQAWSKPPYPVVFGAHWLVAELPALLLVTSVIGLAWWLWRRIRGQVADEASTGMLVALFLFGALVGGALVPPLFASFPPRLFAGASLLAVPSALLVDRLARLAPVRLRGAIPMALLGLLAMVATIHLPTRGAGYSVLAGGTRFVMERALFEPDGSELGAGVVAARAKGVASLAIEEAPRGYGAALKQARRLGGLAITGDQDADLRLVRGDAAGATYRVRYHGAVIWSLVPGRP